MAISTAGTRVYIGDAHVSDSVYVDASDFSDVTWLHIGAATALPNTGVTAATEDDTDISSNVTSYVKGVFAFPEQTLTFRVEPGDEGQAMIDKALMRRCGSYPFRIENGADCGEEETVTIANGADAEITWADSGLADDTPIQLTTTGSLPTPLKPYKIYYAVDVGASGFKLAENPGGDPITTTSEGSGVHTALAMPPGLTQMFMGIVTGVEDDRSGLKMVRNVTIQQTSFMVTI